MHLFYQVPVRAKRYKTGKIRQKCTGISGLT